MTGPRFDHYEWPGGREAMLRFGPEDGPLAIVALPLFEEANRTRAFAATICRALAEHGIGNVLPDFPGAGESLVETRDATVLAMREAYEALAASLVRQGPVHAVGLRSGALLDTLALLDSRWHLAPQIGQEVLRELRRMRPRVERDVTTMIEEGDFAGNSLSEDMLADLHGVSPFAAGEGRIRVVRLDTDPRWADRKLPGAPPWRRAEPANDPMLAAAVAEDIAAWIATCGR